MILRPSTMEKERWRILAECIDMDLNVFFPDDMKKDAAEAKAVCNQCLCWEQCLMYALTEHIEFGIWGGFTPHERKRVRRSLDFASQLDNRRRWSNVRVATNR